MKLWLQFPMKIDPSFKSFFEAGFSVKRSDTSVSVQFLNSGIHTLDQLSYDGMRFFNDRTIVKNIMKAERGKFDAVIIGCYLDPGLHAAKQLLSIPVLGIAETSMHFAAMACSRFAVITSDKHYVLGIEQLVSRYTIEKGVICKSPVRAVTFNSDEYEKHLFSENYEPIIEDFLMVAAACIDDGAELIIAGCGTLAAILTRQGLNAIDDVPIINPLLVTIKLAEAAVDLHKNAHIPPVSRHGSFRRIPKHLYDQLPETFSCP